MAYTNLLSDAALSIVEGVVKSQLYVDSRTAKDPPLHNKCTQVCDMIRSIARQHFGDLIAVEVKVGSFNGEDGVTKCDAHEWIEIFFPTEPALYKIAIDPTYMQFTNEPWSIARARYSAAKYCTDGKPVLRHMSPAQVLACRLAEEATWT
jgi:hypothetical protein